MKTIINITLGGRNIIIEDTAYEKIKAYLESLKKYYHNEEGRDEIITDIENRFSELMHEKIRKGAPHINDADVDEMISAMGWPEDFDQEAGTQGGGTQYTDKSGYNTNAKRRLYRDESNKMIGGVCSGIASWLNIDPTIVRVLFAIISFGGFGSGIIIYILLWIFLPSKNLTMYRGKRMYRNPDDKIIGGVAGGMGAYFNINPTTIRWILAIPLILSALKGVHFFGWDDDFNLFSNLFFSGLSGTFIFVYIVLWIVLPEASNSYQKMEMHGKTIDINTIKENVQHSMGSISSRMKDWSQEVQAAGERIGTQVNTFAQQRGPQFGYEVGQAGLRGGKGIGHAIRMLFKAFFIFIAGTIAVSLFIAFLALIFSGFAWAPVNNFLWTSDYQQMWAWGTLLFFAGAPIVGILVGLTRRILNIRTPGNYLNWLFGGLWVVGWVCLIMFITSISRDMKRVETVETPINIIQPANGKLILKVSQPELIYENGDYSWLNGGNDLDGFNLTADTLKLSAVNINFEKSADSLYHVIVKKEAMGKTDGEAMARVQKLQYNLTSFDSILDLPSGFAIDKDSKYRFQSVSVMVQVPAGKSIWIDPTVKEKLSNGGFNIRHGNNKSLVKWSSHNSLQQYSSNVLYTMNENGDLTGADEKKSNTASEDENYRWDNNTLDTSNTKNIATDTTQVYRYNPSPDVRPVTDTAKERIVRELKQKQKEIEDLQKKLNN